MINPWHSLPDIAPYVLAEDHLAIERFNKGAGPRHSFNLELLPDPYIGRLNSNVLLLALNPGFGNGDLETHRQLAFRARALANLQQRPQPFPFYYLDPGLPGGGRDYWVKKLGSLIRHFGRRHVSERVSCLQFFPYHSCEYKRGTQRIPSQEFNFHHLRQAIGEGRTVVVMRSWRFWSDAVPELLDYKGVIRLQNPRNPTVSRGNCKLGFDSLLNALAD